MRQRGFSLVEVLAAAGIAAVLVAAGAGFAASAHPAAAFSAAGQFDAALAYARALAAAGPDGSTLTISAASIDVFAGRPDPAGALRPAAAPFPIAGVRVSEAATGGTPIAVFLDGEGRATMAGFTGSTPAPMATEPPCPAAGSWVITFRDARTAQIRNLACVPPAGGP